MAEPFPASPMGEPGDGRESLFADAHEAVAWMRQWASTLTYEGDKLRDAAGFLEDSYNDFRNEEERADELQEALRRAAFVAEHLMQMIDGETWRATGGDDGQGHYEGDYRAEQTAVEIAKWKAMAE